MLPVCYDIIACLFRCVAVFLIATYVFLLKPPEKKYIYQFGGTALSLVAAGCFGSLIGEIVLACVLGLFICRCYGKPLSCHFISAIPVLGFCEGFLMPILKVPSILFDSDTESYLIYGIFVYGIGLLACFAFLIRGKEWRKNFYEEMTYRRLAAWETTVLYVIGSLLFLLSISISTYSNLSTRNFRQLIFSNAMLIGLIGFMIALIAIVLILQGNKNARIHEQVTQMQYNIIITLADIVENRDKNTGGHIKRTANYVEILARTLKAQGQYADILTEQYISDMMIAAPLHDMGKIHVSDAILNKQGKLTPEEYEIMKTHTTAGRDLLKNAEKNLGDFSYLEIAVQMAGSHHEWWDGHGYPDGLSGDAIPLCARIMAVADAFDALISPRCYKHAFSLQEACQILHDESGTHFDPTVIDAFFHALPEIEAHLSELSDGKDIDMPQFHSQLS